MIGIIDYGAGNLFSVQKALTVLGFESQRIDNRSQFAGLDQLILPGVGSFGFAMQALGERGLIDPLQDWWRSGKPVLGICLGLQLMTRASEETPGQPGLGWFENETVKLRSGKIPNMGWQRILGVNEEAKDRLGLDDGQSYYFVHSYAVCDAPNGAAQSDHADGFAAVLGQGNCWGLQFHPEKSGQSGLALLKKWGETCR